MRTSLLVMLVVMVVAVGAPNAHADSFTYTYTDTVDGVSWTTAAIPAVTTETTVLAADLTSTSNTGLVAGCVTTGVILDDNNEGNTETFLSGCLPISNFDSFALADYSTPGTYDSTIAGDSLVVTAVATPEPSTIALMLLGVGLVFVLRKRNSRGHQLAT